MNNSLSSSRRHNLSLLSPAANHTPRCVHPPPQKSILQCATAQSTFKRQHRQCVRNSCCECVYCVRQLSVCVFFVMQLPLTSDSLRVCRIQRLSLCLSLSTGSSSLPHSHRLTVSLSGMSTLQSRCITLDVSLSRVAE